MNAIELRVLHDNFYILIKSLQLSNRKLVAELKEQIGGGKPGSYFSDRVKDDCDWD